MKPFKTTNLWTYTWKRQHNGAIQVRSQISHSIQYWQPLLDRWTHPGVYHFGNSGVVATYDYPPVPDRRFDWSAVHHPSYDGPGSPIGRGPWPEDAVRDLLEQDQVLRMQACARANRGTPQL